MNDEQLDPLDGTIRELAEDYRRPAMPLDDSRREQMWQVIAARRGHAKVSVGPPSVAPHPWRRWWPVAAAALLLLGIGIGRGLPTAPFRSGDAASPITGVEGTPLRWKQTTAEALYRLAARDYLRRTQTQLTRFQLASAVPPSAEDEVPVTDWAGALLVRTRIFLDSPLSEDPGMRDLLEDLEVVLARIVQSTDDASLRDDAFILEGMRRQGILERLQERTDDAVPTRPRSSQPATGT